MKITGIIAEYNPFHNGHEYHIKKALEVTGSDAALILMSGDFVQRGAPAVMPKHLRAEAALKGGASIILELPVCYACGSAEFFARGAVSLFDSLGCIDSICFGSECGDIKRLYQIAEIFAKEPEDFRKILKEYLHQGLSFPSARQKALAKYSHDSSLAEILALPNNTLGIEYLKAIHQLHSSLHAYTIDRCESDYHDTELSANYSSASAIRQLFSTEKKPTEFPAPLENQVPASGLTLLKESFQKRYPIYSNDFSLLLKYKLLTETKESLTQYADVSQDLANRIVNQRNSFRSWEQFCNLLKTREITFTRVSRMLLHILLNIRKSDMELYRRQNCAHYARILGFSRADSQLLRELKINSHIPIITKLSDAPPLSEAGTHMLNTDLFAADLYESVVSEKYQLDFINEYCQQISII